MPSTQPNFDLHTLDDDAVLALLAFADWEVKFDKEEEVWLVKPPTPMTTNYSVCETLADAGNYFLMWQKFQTA